ncbi:MAG TPA: M48 family metalloprotease [Solimonas sp.]|nr:M48 family metalloprotease [Solimonas sp.]
MPKLRLASCVAALVLAAAGSTLAAPPSALDLPQIGEPADNTLSPTEEKQLGARVMSQIYAQNYLIEDAELSDYITTLGWKLVAASRNRGPEMTFFVIRDERINAFALPGGYVGFNAGLLLAASNESEVAGVMGHELAHVTQRHIARTAEDTEIASIATWLAVIAAIIAGSADPDVVIGALAIGQGVNYQRQVSYTRAHEQEADRIGIQTMARAGFDPQAMASFFQKLEQQSRLYGSGMPEILRTHPLNTSRVAEARARAGELGRPAAAREELDFLLMQARTRVLVADRPSQSLDYYGRELAAGHDSPQNRYGMALSLSRLGDARRATEILAPLAAQHPRQPNIQLLSAQLAIQGGQPEAGLEQLARTLRLHPRYAPAILAYAEALAGAGRYDAARQLLISREQAQGTQLATYSLLSQVARESGNLAEASFQMANYLYLRGDAGNALAQLDAALRQPDLSPQELARLSAKRKEVRESLPSNWRPPRDGRQR